MSFLAPLFFIGLAAIAVPIFVHLIQRERKHVTKFPSLMFVRRIPYQSVRRRRIRHWFLLMMRIAALALIIAAFARPFFRQGAAATVAAMGGDREIVILLDQSASMGYGDHWERARTAAREAIRSLRSGDRATLVLFGRNAEENMRATSDIGRLEAALDAAKLTSGATRYGPALKLAESILTGSTLTQREAILISDFQRVGWSTSEDVHFGESIRLTPVSVASDKAANLSVSVSPNFGRASFSGQERITVTAGVSNHGADRAANVPVTLELEGRQMESVSANAAANAAASVAFAPFTLAEPAVRGTVRAGTDPLAADNAFHFVLTPSTSVPVLVIDSGERNTSSFFLSKALSIGTTPAFQTEVVPAARVSATTLERRSVVILHDAMVPPGAAGGVLRRYVERGGGLLVAFGARTSWPTSEADLLPGKLGATVDPAEARGATLVPDYSHSVFEVFKAPRSGDFSAVRIFRYRALEPGPDDRVLARYDDGTVAAAEKRIGTGRVIAWSTTFDDSWNDLARKPIYLPLVHQLVKYLARYEQPTSWNTVGDVVDLSALLKSRAERVVMTPSGERVRVPATEAGLLELNEQGVYEVRTGSGSSRPDRIAVNLDPAESDLTPLDPQELVAAVTGRAVQTAADGTTATPALMSPEEAEKRQGLWWYLLVGGLMLLAAEMAVSNVLSRSERFT
jgi:hypothetical protein